MGILFPGLLIGIALASGIHSGITGSAPVVTMGTANLDMGQTIALAVFAIVFFLRYFRTVVGIFTYAFYKPKPIAANPKYKAKNATVIIPTTFKTPVELVQCIKRCLACQPARIFIVTSRSNVPLVKNCCKVNEFSDIVKVIGVEKLNKREQMLKAIPKAKTPIIVFADDDVFWPDKTYLDRLLPVFENDNVGAGGTRQRVRREQNAGWSAGFWNILGISYLERRVWNNATTNAIDGTISTLSGRTSAYRADILQSEEFYHYFRNDTWRGKPLNSDDDKCLTRYVYSHGWKICLQFDPKAVLETTVEQDIKYLSQCMRWARAHWRGNFTVMENETYWRSPSYLWGCYVIYFGQFFTPAILVEGILFALLRLAVGGTDYYEKSFAALVAWIIFTKNVKMIPHFWKHPKDMMYIPVLMLFSYFHGFLNVYAAFSMQQTQWGSQNLNALENARATKNEELIPLLGDTLPILTPGAVARLSQILDNPEGGTDAYGIDPTPGNVIVGDEYFDE